MPRSAPAQTRRPLDAARTARVHELYEEHAMSAAAIAAALGTDAARVRRALKDRGVAYRANRPPRGTQGSATHINPLEARRKYLALANLAAAAGHFKVSPKVLRRILAYTDTPIARRGRPRAQHAAPALTTTLSARDTVGSGAWFATMRSAAPR